MLKTENKEARWRLVLIAISGVAMLLCGIIHWHHITGGMIVGCDGGSSCDEVLGSRWSTIGGVLPVSMLAMGAYLSLFIALFFVGFEPSQSIRRICRSFIVFVSGAILGSAIWFTILQKWIIGEFCVYCMTLHLIGVITSVLIIWRAYLLKAAKLPGLFAAGLFMAALLMILQLTLKPGPTAMVHQETEESLVKDQIENIPTIGPVDAKYAIILLYDYQCSHCQRLHFLLNEVVRRYRGQLAFVLCPTPLEHRCNPYVPEENRAFENSCELAKIALAVCLSEPGSFPEFENWMFSYESGSRWKPRTRKAALTKARRTIGEQALEAGMEDPRLAEYLQMGVRLFGKTTVNGRGGIPKMIFEDRWIIPVPNVHSADDLMSVLQQNLGIPEP